MIDDIERYKMAKQEVDDNLRLLFDRLYYFLVAMTFVIGGFITIVTIVSLDTSTRSDILWLVHIICATGYYISLSLTYINYLNAKIIYIKSTILEEYEQGERLLPTLQGISDEVFCQLKKQFTVKEFLHDFTNIVKIPSGELGRYTPPHTWLIPLGFTFLWAVIWARIVPAAWNSPFCEFFNVSIWPQTVFIFMPLLILTILKWDNKDKKDWQKFLLWVLIILFVAQILPLMFFFSREWLFSSYWHYPVVVAVLAVFPLIILKIKGVF